MTTWLGLSSYKFGQLRTRNTPYVDKVVHIVVTTLLQHY